MRLSANLGFLWADLPVADRVYAAAKAGFDAVEFHDHVQGDVEGVRAALAATGLPVMGLNVRMGETAGCAAIPGMFAQACADFDAALAAAEAVNAGAIHVMAGKTLAPDWDQFRAVVARAAAATDRIILLEPISAKAMPGYPLNTCAQAAGVISDVGADTVKIMFDLFHVAAEDPDLTACFARYRPLIGHVQIADMVTRAEPERATCNVIAGLDWRGPLGCEYRAAGDVAAGLAWRDLLAT